MDGINGGELREIVKVLREILVNRQYQDYQAVINNLEQASIKPSSRLNDANNLVMTWKHESIQKNQI